jgi:poly [ADP-ribose] polymerase
VKPVQPVQISKNSHPSSKVSPTKPSQPSKQANASTSPPAKEETKMVKAVRKGRAAVDTECPKAKDTHVYEEGAKVWTVTLNQADLKNNANKYYIIQLLQSDTSGNQFFVWNRWGRVGYSGQNALKGPFGDLNRAKADYEAKLRDKTRGGYIEVQIVYEEENEPKPETPKTTKSAKGKQAKEVKSNLDKRVSDLINLIFDLKSINRTLAEIGYDSKKMPLGKLSIATIKQGMEVLKQIETALNSNRKGDLEGLSSRFYSLIPHDFGFQKMSNFILNNSEKLKGKVEMLESLADMKIATNILEASTEGNPHDEHYKKLNCKLAPLEKNDPVYKTLETYVKNTHGNTHSYYTLEVQDIFRVDKSGESEKFVKNIKNNMLLWHGSRLTNWVGILSQGLRIAPPEAPVSGYMFGKGVYFADMVSKSANYCFTSKDNNTGILLLCDVAVGNYNEKIHSDYNASNLPKGKHSTKGCGLTAPPEKSYITLEGCKVPIGQGEKVNINGGYLQYNEYIVYNTNQIRMKFLLKVKFNYKY